jgi:hypothetical protein
LNHFYTLTYYKIPANPGSCRLGPGKSIKRAFFQAKKKIYRYVLLKVVNLVSVIHRVKPLLSSYQLPAGFIKTIETEVHVMPVVPPVPICANVIETDLKLLLLHRHCRPPENKKPVYRIK